MHLSIVNDPLYIFVKTSWEFNSSDQMWSLAMQTLAPQTGFFYSQ